MDRERRVLIPQRRHHQDVHVGQDLGDGAVLESAHEARAPLKGERTQALRVPWEDRRVAVDADVQPSPHRQAQECARLEQEVRPLEVDEGPDEGDSQHLARLSPQSLEWRRDEPVVRKHDSLFGNPELYHLRAQERGRRHEEVHLPAPLAHVAKPLPDLRAMVAPLS